MTETDATSIELKKTLKAKDKLEGLCRALQEERKILTKTLGVIEKRLFKHFGERAGKTLLEADILEEDEEESVDKNGWFKNKQGRIEVMGDLVGHSGYDEGEEELDDIESEDDLEEDDEDDDEEEEEEENIMEQPYI